MTLRKVTIVNSVRYIPKSGKTKTSSLPRKQNKKFSQNNKKFVKDFAASGFGKLTNLYLYNYIICNTSNYMSIYT